RVMRLLGCSSATVLLYDSRSLEVVVAATRNGSLDVGRRFAMDTGLSGRVATTGQPILIEDYQSWEHGLPELAAHGVRAVMMVPMTCGGELIGTLGVAEYSTERTYSDADVRLLSLYAAHAASSIRSVQLLEAARAHATDLLRDNAERRRIEEALRQSEERYRTLVEEMNDVVYTFDLEGRFTYVSPALER